MRTIPALLLVGAIVATPAARAGNLDSFFLGNHAAMTGGAILPVTRGSDALWYNPAGLGGVLTSSLDLSGSAFVVRFRDLPEAIQTTTVDGTRIDELGSIEILSVPTSLVFVRNFTRGLTGAIGIFVPSQDEFRASHVTEAPAFGGTGTGLDYDDGIFMRWRFAEYHTLLGLGWQIVPSFRIGLSLSFVYSATEVSTQFWTHTYAPGQVQQPFQSVALVQQDILAKSFGGQMSMGIQWEFAPTWHLGLTIRSPTLLFAVWGDQFAVAAFAGVFPGATAEADLAHDAAPPELDGVEVLSPMRVLFGLSKEFGWGTLTLEGDVQPGFSNETLGIDMNVIGNARVGVKYDISKKFSGGVGLFTDLAAEPPPDGLGTAKVDYFGVAFGFEFRTPYKVSDKEGAKALVFSTTVGLRYALGIGEAGAIRFNPSATGLEGDPYVEDLVERAIFHEVTLHIGSAVNF